MKENKPPVQTDRSQLWADSRHWNRDGSYNCAADPRLLVRARGGLGWTMNMAHPRAQIVLWGFVFFVLALVTGLGLMIRAR